MSEEPVYYDKDGRPYTVKNGVSVWLPTPPPDRPPDEEASGAPGNPVVVSSPGLSKEEAERNKRTRTFAIWVVGVLMLMGLIGEIGRRKSSSGPGPNRERETAASSAPALPTQPPVLPIQPPDTVHDPLLGITKGVREIEENISLLRRSGIVTSIDKVNHEVQVNRMLWERLPLDSRKGVVLWCALYLLAQDERERGHGSAYTVLVDNRTGKKLAENTGWSGIQVFGD